MSAPFAADENPRTAPTSQPAGDASGAAPEVARPAPGTDPAPEGEPGPGDHTGGGAVRCETGTARSAARRGFRQGRGTPPARSDERPGCSDRAPRSTPPACTATRRPARTCPGATALRRTRRRARASFASAAAVTALTGLAFSAVTVQAATPTSGRGHVEQPRSPQQIARALIPDDRQYEAFARIVHHESRWKVDAKNPTSGAYGLLQALPAEQMASVGRDWRTNPTTQIRWGLAYMEERYGSPMKAWEFWQRNHWY